VINFQQGNSNFFEVETRDTFELMSTSDRPIECLSLPQLDKTLHSIQSYSLRILLFSLQEIELLDMSNVEDKLAHKPQTLV